VHCVADELGSSPCGVEGGRFFQDESGGTLGPNLNAVSTPNLVTLQVAGPASVTVDWSVFARLTFFVE
jgi:hypothetical protein